jgi:transposase
VADLKLRNPGKIGVDEIAYQKGHKYLTVVRDLDKGIVIWVHEGRKKETLNLFFKELGKLKSYSIKVAVIDMWDLYIASVKENTDAEIVFDKFHIAKKINDALDNVRKQEFANASPDEQKNFKKKRFIILYRNERLTEEKKEKLNDLMAKNDRLYRAYLLKEQALDIFDEQNEKTALERLERWFANVKNGGFKQFDSVAGTLKRYFYGIKNYFKHHLTNAASEGFNNKINVIKRRAYGFHDLEYFKLKILQSCGYKVS